MSNSVHDFDNNVLSEYLKLNIPDFEGPISSKKFSGGQSNPTFLLSTKSGQYVLRRKPPGQLLKSAHAVDREYKVLVALDNSNVPLAKPFCLCEDDNIIGSMFYVMSYEDGRIFWDPALPELTKENRKLFYNELIRTLAAIHSVDINKVGLGEYGKPGNYFKRQLSTWTKQYRASETDRLESVEMLINWLGDNMPENDDQVSLIHGDYRFDNVIFDHQQTDAIAVLDWELSTLGHPMADLAYFCMCLRLPANSPVKGLAGLDLIELGLPTEEEIIDQYCQLRGIAKIEHWSFYLAFSFFRLAAIAQGVYKRSLNGNASSDQAKEAGNFAGLLSQFAMQTITEES